MHVLEEFFSGCLHQDWSVDFPDDPERALMATIDAMDAPSRNRVAGAIDELLDTEIVDDTIIWRFHGNLRPSLYGYSAGRWLRQVALILRGQIDGFVGPDIAT